VAGRELEGAALRCPKSRSRGFQAHGCLQAARWQNNGALGVGIWGQKESKRFRNE
jgi:hypothetical protein